MVTSPGPTRSPPRSPRATDEWQASWAIRLVEPGLEPGEVLDVTSLTPDRGDILGARGLALVTERQVSRVGIDKPSVDPAQAEPSARALAKLVGIDPGDYAKAVNAAGPQAFVEAIVYRQEEVTPGLVQGVEAIAGGRVLADSLPLAPTREFAAPLLGRVGEVTAEMIEENPDAYQAGDVAGISGLQARYDETLRGTPGLKVDAVDDGGVRHELHRIEPTPGTPLQLSLDLDLQTEAELLLADVGPASALVALRPSTGDIVAAANGPGTGGLNLATFGQFAPGSTFKSVSSLALLRAGLTPDSVVPCTASIVVDGKTFTNYDDYPSGALGNIPLRTALANSCNTAFISQAGKLQGTDLFDAGVSLGIGLDHDLGFPAYFGSVEPSTSKTESAAQLIGQGTILASPMVMAAVIGSAQSGQLVVPRMVDGVEVSAPEGAKPLERGGGRGAALDAPVGRHRRQRPRAGRRPGPAGDRQDRHRRVRLGRRPADARLDDRGAGRPGRGGLRRGRRVRARAPRARSSRASCAPLSRRDPAPSAREEGPVVTGPLSSCVADRGMVATPKSGPPAAWGQRGALADFAVLPPKSTAPAYAADVTTVMFS